MTLADYFLHGGHAVADLSTKFDDVVVRHATADVGRLLNLEEITQGKRSQDDAQDTEERVVRVVDDLVDTESSITSSTNNSQNRGKVSDFSDRAENLTSDRNEEENGTDKSLST